MTKRKTIDIWEIWVQHDGTWECDCIELTRKEAREQYKTYVQNCVFPVKIRKRRIKPENLASHNPEKP